MAMKPSLTLRLGQQLRMTPQLQQAIRLLQLSTFDLQQEIQEALDSNLMLEEVDTQEQEPGEETTSLDPPDEIENSSDSGTDTEVKDAGVDTADDEQTLPPDPEIDGDPIPDTSEQITSEKIADELPVDSVWEDIYEESVFPQSY